MSVELVVGTNTYVTLDDAKTYLSSQLYTDAWDAVDDDTKSKALLLAAKHIDSLHVRGRKADATQKMVFPRAIYHSRLHDYGWPLSGSGWFVESVVAECVKQAQCIEALAILSNGESMYSRAVLQDQGVTRLTLGDLTEVYSGKHINSTIQALEVKQLLKYYIIASFPIM